jgi:hypothetical protein
VALAFVAVFAGTFLSLLQHFRELPLFWIYFQRLLSSQGFLLLPILGISGDIWPHVLRSHYSCGAILWVVGTLAWAIKVLPKTRIVEDEDEG